MPGFWLLTPVFKCPLRFLACAYLRESFMTWTDTIFCTGWPWHLVHAMEGTSVTRSHSMLGFHLPVQCVAIGLVCCMLFKSCSEKRIFLSSCTFLWHLCLWDLHASEPPLNLFHTSYGRWGGRGCSPYMMGGSWGTERFKLEMPTNVGPGPEFSEC